MQKAAKNSRLFASLIARRKTAKLREPKGMKSILCAVANLRLQVEKLLALK